MKAIGKKTRADSTVTETELQEAFSHYDEDGTGFIRISKLKFVMRFLGFEPRQREIDLLIDKMIENDAARAVNKNAFTIEELSYLLSSEKGPTNDAKKEIMSTFQLFDTANKGYINFEDLKRISVELGENLSDEELRQMITEANPSSCGRVSKEHFEKVMRNAGLY